MSVVPQVSGNWQAGFLAVLPAVQTHAKIVFRRWPAERRQEAVQEAIAAAAMAYQRLAAQGRLDVAHPGTIATNAARHVRNGRHVGGRQNGAKDPLSPVCQERHGITVVSAHAHRSGVGSDGWRQVAIAERKASIPDTAAFRIDFACYLRKLSRRDRKIINAFVSGGRGHRESQTSLALRRGECRSFDGDSSGIGLCSKGNRQLARPDPIRCFTLEDRIMSSDRLVTSQHVLRAVMEYERRGSTKVLSELEKLEPDLIEYFLETLTRLHHQLTSLGLSGTDARKVYRRAEKMTVVCIMALRNAHRDLWDKDPTDRPPGEPPP